MPARAALLRTARIVLAWFAAFLLVAGIAPWLQEAGEDVPCSPVALQGGKSLPHPAHKLECSLCAGVAAPPSAIAAAPAPAVQRGQALLPYVALHVAGTSGAPLPARGPPSFS